MLQLDNYFFPIVHVIATPGYNEKDGTGPAQTNVDVEGSYSIEGRKLESALTIKVRPKDEETPIPYSVELMVIGVFEIEPKSDSADKYVALNGFALLYGAAREFLLTITGRGPWEAVQLPTYYFTPDGINEGKMEKESTTNDNGDT